MEIILNLLRYEFSIQKTMYNLQKSIPIRTYFPILRSVHSRGCAAIRMFDWWILFIANYTYNDITINLIPIWFLSLCINYYGKLKFVELFWFLWLIKSKLILLLTFPLKATVPCRTNNLKYTTILIRQVPPSTQKLHHNPSKTHTIDRRL